ncbi:MAG TPA: CRTAC1 family protein, partial [Vicinamibacterales bacterium]|nr:CRTAC1 family protein [Vicinamibacterales bacterium]
VFALSDGRERFHLVDAPAATSDASLALFLDYDNDGLLDLLVATPRGPHVARNLGNAWSEETAAAAFDREGARIRSIALGDLDRDGDTDAVIVPDSGVLQLLRNDGGNRHKSVTVSLAARVSNRSGLGAKVEVRAGGLRQMLETSAASPAGGPADLVFGLGTREAADVVRVLWPSGILQSELSPASPARVEELDRKPSSCPYLFIWNGSRFEFITDFLGGGEMGDWAGPGQFNAPDPDEYVRIPDGALVARDGRYEIRITNELEEAMFLDKASLVTIDHPADVEIYPAEGLKDLPRPPVRFYAVRSARVPDRVVDDHGHDVRVLVAERDRRWPDDFALLQFRGYAEPHGLTLDVGKGADDAVLLLTGWTSYAFSTDNVAASQAGLTLQPPALQVRTAAGAWQTVDTNLGFPVGRPQTLVVDMKGRWLGPSREVRIVTNMPIYWDQVRVALPAGIDIEQRTIQPATATLQSRGYSAEASPDGREPFGAVYESVTTKSPWKAFPGAYTREGDVRALLERVDDMFVIAEPGDEISLSFDASGRALQTGWTRSFFLLGDGFSKEMNIRSATPDTLGPLPFHAMTRYPYGSDEHYPTDAAHRAYLQQYNTRVITRVVRSIDAAALSQGSHR